MTADEYWHSEGIRLLNEDGTLPSVEQRVKAGYDHGWVNGMVMARDLDRDEIEREPFTKAARLLAEYNRRNGK